MPALMHLAIESGVVSPVARGELQNWAARRDCCFYVVVQEETDDHLSLTASSWPLVDDRGRLRFPISVDPVEFHTERRAWRGFVDAHRGHWRELGVLGDELATRPIQLGDTFALRFNKRSGTAIDPLRDRLERPGQPTELHLQPRRQVSGDGIPVMELIAHPVPARRGRRRSTVARTVGWLTDITWDARQAGKVAQLAAFAGALDTGTSDTAHVGDDQRIDEGVDRQFRAFVAGVDPDQAVALDDDSLEPASER